jgi:hypothetical protein
LTSKIPLNGATLLQVVLEKAAWKGGELRMSFKTPLAEIALSNRERRDDSDHLRGTLSNFDSWRATVDAFRTFLADNAASSARSNLAIQLLIQELTAHAAVVDPSGPTSRDTPRTSDPDSQLNRRPEKSNAKRYQILTRPLR